MIKILFILFPFASFGQFTIERIAYDSGPGGNDTLWTRDGSNKDTLFRRTAGVFQFGNKPYFRKLWTSVDVMDWDGLYSVKQNTLVSGTNIKTVNGNNLLGAGDVSISGSAAWGSVTGTLSNQTDLQNALNLKAPLASPTFTGTVSGVTSTHVGLGNVTNESKATMFTSPTFTGTPVGIGIPVFARVTGSNATTTGQALVDITGLSVSLIANATYEVECMLSGSTTAVTTGTGYGIQYSAAGATIEGWVSGSSTTTAAKSLRLNAFNTSSQAWLTTSAQTGGIFIKGIVTVGANAGTLTARHLKVTSGTSTVFIGSYIKITRIL